MQTFAAAPLDAYAERITLGLAYLGGLLCLPLLFAYLSGLRWGNLLIPIGVAVPLLVLLLLAYSQQPRDYRINDQHLEVRRRWLRPLRVPLDEIVGVSTATALADVPRRGLRFSLNAGIFGYQGPFLLDPYGRTFFLATNRQRLVLVGRRRAPALVISPARPGEFVDALRRVLAEGSEALESAGLAGHEGR